MANDIKFELDLVSGKFLAAVQKAAASLKPIESSLKSIQASASKSFSTKNVVKFGAALVGVQTAALAVRKAMLTISNEVSGSVKTFADFEKGMLSVRTLLDDTSFAGKTAEQGFKQLSTEMSEFLRTIPADAQAATSALFDITSAQIGAADATKVLTAAGKLAVAGNSSVATSTKALVKSIVAYGLDAKNAETIAGKFFTAQKVGLTTVEELAAGIQTVAASASQLGISLDETLAAVVGSTRGALGTQKAFIGLGAALKNIVKPSEEAKKVAQELNIEFSEKGIQRQGGLIPFFQNLEKQLKGNNQAMTTLFGSARSFRQVAALFTKEGGKGAAQVLRSLSDETKTATTLNDNYRISVSALSNKWQLFSNNLDEVRKSIVAALGPSFGGILDDATAAMQRVFNQLQDPDTQAQLKLLGESLRNLGRDVLDMLPSFERLTYFFYALTDVTDTVVKAISGLTSSTAPAADTFDKMADTALSASEKLQVLEAQLADLRTKQDNTSNPYVKTVQLQAQIEQKLLEIEQARAAVAKEQLTPVKAVTVAIKEQVAEKEKSNKADVERSKRLKAIANNEADAIIRAAKQAEKSKLQVISESFAQQAKEIQDNVKKGLITREKGNQAIAGLEAKLVADLQDLHKNDLAEVEKAQKSALDNLNQRAQAARFVGKTEMDVNAMVYSDTITKINDQVSKGLLSEQQANDLKLAEHKIFLDKQTALEDEQRKDREAKEKAFWSSIFSAVGSAFSTLKSGVDAQKGITTAQAGVSEAKVQLDEVNARIPISQDSIDAITSSINQGTEKLSDLEEQSKKDQLYLKQLRGLRRTDSRDKTIAIAEAQLQETKDLIDHTKQRLAEDKDRFKIAETAQKDRNDDLKKAIEGVEDATKQVKEATEARNEQAKQALIGGASAAANIAIPGLGQVVGPALDLLTQDKEQVKEFITALVEQIPVIVEALADNAPVIMEALAAATPRVIEALIRNAPQITTAIANGTWLAFRALIPGILNLAAEGLREAVGGLKTLVDGLFQQFLPNLLNGLKTGLANVFDFLVKAVTEPLKAIWEGLTNLVDNIKSALSGGAVGDKVTSTVGKAKSFLGLATGGQVIGSGNRDTVPAMLSPGELVVDRTTGPRLNKFLDDYAKPQAQTEDNSLREAVAFILSEVRKPIQVTSDLTLNGDVLGNIILDLNRRQARLS